MHSIQELLAHKIPYQRPSAARSDAAAYLKEEAPTHPEADVTTLAMPPTSVIQAIIEALWAPLSGVKYMAYWAELGPVWESQKSWNGAIQCTGEQIRKDESSDPLAEQVLDRILALPWYSGLQGFYEANVEGLMLELLDGDEMLQTNRVAHYINPERFPLLDPQACDNERLYMLGKILDRHEFLSEDFQHVTKNFAFSFRFDLTGDIESVDDTGDPNPSTPVSHPPPPSPTRLTFLSPMKGKVKRALGDRNLSSPPASPMKKKPNAKREKVIAAFRLILRGFLRMTMEWSERKSTKAAQHTPKNWEDVCERAALRRAYVIKREDIPAELIVNSDQTGVVYNPSAKLTWAPRGSPQVAVIGADEKRAFTTLLAISLSGKLLPGQGVSAAAAGFRHLPSKTGNHWANLGTMQDFVIHILDPYFQEEKKRLGLPPDQKSLWILDVWSVQVPKRARLDAHQLPQYHARLHPRGCTGVSQPLDVGINRPFKQALKTAYHAYVVETLMAQMARGEEVHFDTHIGPLRDASVAWLWAAYSVINNPVLIKKSARVEPFLRKSHLSAIRARLRKEEDEKTEFWKELQGNKADKYLPSESKEIAEDIVDEEEGPDDSDISPAAVVADVTGQQKPKRSCSAEEHGKQVFVPQRLLTTSMWFQSRSLKGEMVLKKVEEQGTGRATRTRKPNQHYLGPGWLYRDDEQDSESDEEFEA
ncbi:hypothetical protein B0H14DRAFT_3736749 [Mycena olivaceomarginata]|nr:hypothetical protein B0H14DRAFT_3736749 [Mycena olivaceomarginata]